MIKLPAQRVGLVDNLNHMATDWYKSVSLLVRAVNNKRVTSSAAAYSLTGSIDATAAASMSLQMGNTGLARLSLAFSHTANANAKTAVVKIGDTTIQTITIGTDATSSAQVTIIGRSASSQYTSLSQSVGCTGSGGIATTENMANSVTITVTLQLGINTDTFALESWALEVEQV